MKEENFSKFCIFKNQIENETSEKLLMLRINKRCDFLFEEFEEFCHNME